MTREATNCTLRELVLKFIPEAIGKMIEKECNGIFPLTHVYVRKVKLLQSPKFDPTTFQQLHLPTGEDTGVSLTETATATTEGGDAGAAKKGKGFGKGGSGKTGGGAGKSGGGAGGAKKGGPKGGAGGTKKKQ